MFQISHLLWLSEGDGYGRIISARDNETTGKHQYGGQALDLNEPKYRRGRVS
jgi:hypothetical protein